MRKKSKTLLEDFLCGSLGSSASAVLNDGACVTILVDQDQFSFVVHGGKGVVRAKEAPTSDISLMLSFDALCHLVEQSKLPQADLASVAIEIVHGMLSKTPDRAIGLKVHVGPFVLWRRGYLNLLMLGGKPLLNLLATHGLSGVQEVLSILKKFRS
jgi:hypothetical protein